MEYKIDYNFTGTEIIHGDVLSVLPAFPDNLFGGIITDPPYSSGASTLTSKQQTTAQKYTNRKSNNTIPSFAGDSKDQRSWTRWMTEWLVEAKRVTKTGSPICIFSDWRMLPALTDALQWADWTYRGIVVWDKINSRPQRGRFRQQTEFVIFGSNGTMSAIRNVPTLPGVFRESMPAPYKKIHQTEKPTGVMQQLVKIVEPEGIILDPFAGAGTTILAAALEGYSAVGIEISKHFANAARERIKEVVPAV
jgi:site-specific DNA-methyltransferase (adenine-specific)